MKINLWEILFAVLISVFMAGILVLGGIDFGKKTERAKWLAKDNTELTTANAKIKSLEEKYRQQEHDAADAIAVISSQYEQELKHVKADKDRIIADLRGGAYRLRIPVASAFNTCGGIASQAAPATSSSDGEARAELSGAAAEFLVGLTSEADEVAKQLGACQAVINADRNMGNNDGRQ